MAGELQAGDPESAGPYRLLGRLGGGGMGRVYLGRSPGGRLVAVKVIRPELAEDADFRTRFAREVAAARNVSGLFTALVIDADPKGPIPWLATAYVPGPTLAEAVEDQGPLPVASVLALAAGLAEGLGAIHAARVVHRDLKPSNVLIAADGPRVIDFGVSKAVEATMLTQSGIVMGSPGFMSPEQVEGNEVGPPSDVFSLGAVLAYAACGQGPFGTGPTSALLYRVVHGQPDISGVPEELRSLTRRCLAKDPASRPTPSDLLAELGAGRFAVDWLSASLAGTLEHCATVPKDPVPKDPVPKDPVPHVLVPLPQNPAFAADTQSVIRPAARASDPDADPGGTSHRNHRRWVLVVAVAILVIAGCAATTAALTSANRPRHGVTTLISSMRPRVRPRVQPRVRPTSSGALASSSPSSSPEAAFPLAKPTRTPQKVASARLPAQQNPPGARTPTGPCCRPARARTTPPCCPPSPESRRSPASASTRPSSSSPRSACPCLASPSPATLSPGPASSPWQPSPAPAPATAKATAAATLATPSPRSLTAPPRPAPSLFSASATSASPAAGASSEYKSPSPAPSSSSSGAPWPTPPPATPASATTITTARPTA
jgi:serine/threonine protein kinase